MEIVTADGDVVRSWDRQSAIVNLGALGIVTALTLHIEPAYDLRQVIYENLSFSVLSSNLDDIFGAGYSVSLFTDWRNHQAAQVWLKAHAGQGLTREFFGAKAATRKLHPIAGYSAESCTDQFGVPGPWYERLPHFRMDFTPSSGEELQSEYFVPRERGYEAILAVEKLRDQIAPHLMISELRTIDADDLWMSPCYQRESLAIHFTWKPDWPAVKNVLPLIEEQLAPFDARPHWAKLFTMPPARLQSLYEKLPAFRALLKQHDPAGKFRNDYLNGKLLVDS
jgi:xylitol oxidase